MDVVIDGYKTCKVLEQNEQEIFLLCQRVSDNRCYYVHILNDNTATHITRRLYEHNYFIALLLQQYQQQQLSDDDNSTLVIREELEESDIVLQRIFDKDTFPDSITTISEYTRSQSGGKLTDINNFIAIATNIVRKLDEIQKQHILHLNLSPRNILIDTNTFSVQIVNYGHSELISEKVPYICTASLRSISSNLEYTPPEMNPISKHDITYYSDIYSLGSIFYFMLSGFPPQATERKVHVSTHFPTLRNDRKCTHVPETLERIISTMTEKSPSKRYTSLYAVLSDLEKLKSIEPSHYDISSNKILTIESKLYGKDGATVRRMIDSIKQVQSDSKTQIYIISGEKSTGKSLLYEELYRSRANFNEHMLFAYGEFERNGSVYSSGFTHAIRRLLNKLLSDREDKTAIYRNKLKALGGKIAFISHFIPELSVILENPDDEEFNSKATAEEALVGFYNAMEHFLRAFCTEGITLCLFLDDIHNASKSGIKILQNLLTLHSLSLVIVATYNATIAENNDPLKKLLKSIAKKKASYIYNGALAERLTQNDVDNIVADTLKMKVVEIQALSKEIHLKAAGQAMLCKQVFYELWRDKLLKYETESWTWDLDGIKSVTVYPSYFHQVTSKLMDYSDKVRHVLKVASAFGTAKIALVFIAEVADMQFSEVWNILQLFVSDGWMTGLRKGCFEFVNEELQSYAYKLLTLTEAVTYHRKIAECYLGFSVQRYDIICTILYHLEFDIENIKNNPSLLTIYMNLNVCAAEASLHSAETGLALEYIDRAKSLLPVDPWSNSSLYKSSMKISKLRGDILFALGRAEEALSIFENLQRKAESSIDLYRVKYKYLTVCSALGKYEIIYDEYMDILAGDSDTLCLVSNDDNFIQQWIQDAVVILRESLSQFQSLSNILEMDNNPNKERRYFMKCLIQCTAGIYLGRNANKVYLFVTPLLVGKILLNEGLCGEMSLPILANLGWIIGFINDPALGYELASLAVQAGKSSHITEKSFIMAVFYHCFAYVCKGTIHDVLSAELNTFLFARNLKEEVWCPLSGMWAVFCDVYCGSGLEKIEPIYQQVRDVCESINNNFLLDVCKADYTVAQSIRNEKIVWEEPEQMFLNEKIEDLPFSRASVRFAKAIYYYLHNDYKNAYTAIKEAGSLMEDAFGTPLHLVYRWYSVVIIAGRYETYSEEEASDKKKTFSIMEAMLGRNALPKSPKEKILDEFRKQVTETEALYQTFTTFMEPAYYLSQAEASRLGVSHQESDTVDLYAKAITLSKQQNLTLLCSIASTRLASLPNIQSDTLKAKYVENAIQCWKSMGATAIADRVSAQFSVPPTRRSESTRSLSGITKDPDLAENLRNSFKKSMESIDGVPAQIYIPIVQIKQSSSSSLTMISRSNLSDDKKNDSKEHKQLWEQIIQKNRRIEQLSAAVEALTEENNYLRNEQSRTAALVQLAKQKNDTPKSGCFPGLFQRQPRRVFPDQ